MTIFSLKEKNYIYRIYLLRKSAYTIFRQPPRYTKRGLPDGGGGHGAAGPGPGGCGTPLGGNQVHAVAMATVEVSTQAGHNHYDTTIRRMSGGSLSNLHDNLPGQILLPNDY